MDMRAIGAYLARLRREKGLTQEELGERLGVTNKTVSRWETGAYLPPVEMLALLSELYGVTINEIVAARPLNAGEYARAADENLKTALEESVFTAAEKLRFFRNKWRREHVGLIVAACALCLGLLVAAQVRGEPLLASASALAGILAFAHLRNRMQAYAEERVFGPTRR